MEENLKQLLLKDLCARLPYHLLGRDAFGKTREMKVIYPTGTIIAQEIDGENCSSCGFVPYLRSMSSMTQEEKIKLYQITGFYYFSNNELLKDEWRQFSNALSENKLFLPYPIWEDDLQKTFDWLNANHFDYRGLIPMGLALEVPKDMYNTKIE